MTTPKQIAKHVRGVYFGGNWSDSNLKEQLSDITWQEANTEIYSLNTILKLVYHVHYFVLGVSEVLRGKPLVIKDKFSFDHPKISNAEEWDQFVTSILDDGEKFAKLIEIMPPEKINDVFEKKEYGDYFSNLIGIIEHLHYHLGQIVVLKIILRQKVQN